MIKRSLQQWACRAVLVATIVGLATTTAVPCTTFCLHGKDGPFFGRNYDWNIGVGLLVVNKRHQAKTALVFTGDTPATWTSKYGSISFTQYGREFPMGGLNEAGLVVEQMWLDGSRYPAADDRAALQELQWIQYQLDNCESVDEVVATDATLRVVDSSAPLHFLVCDRTGEMATVEFLAGEMIVHRGDSLPVPALANSPYSQSIDYLELFEGFGGEREISESFRSLDRFARAACGVTEYEAVTSEETVSYAFGILADVAQGGGTKWSIVYDVDGLAIHFRTTESPAIKSLALADFDFSPETPCRVLDIDTSEAGNVSARFIEYTTEINRELIFDAWKKTEFLAGTPDAVLDRVAAYPESLRSPVHAASPAHEGQ